MFIKKILKYYFILSFILTVNCSFAKTQVLIYADDGYQPYSFVNNGKPDGIYYDILKIAFARMKNFEVVVQTIPWKRGLQEVEQGIVFAIYPPYYRPVDRAWMAYSKKILDEKYTMFCRATKKIKAKKKWPDDYKGLVVTKNSGFALPPIFMEAVKKGYVSLSEVRETERNLMKVIAHHADCYVNDELGIQIELARMKKIGKYNPKNNEDKIIKIMDLSNENGYIGYLKNNSKKFPYTDSFVKEFNNIITDMIKSGEIDKIKSQFIKKY
ncbi:substrate-binding periplasmic protein [Fluviispira multicolorata]|uniref:Transporter substrate-binding domain-containing protein n=1 Tax=Fluviispira multicolorata TaxID=2654512 RepID=A0A833N7V2_9BACT|nr:transporter substrate-binding domain-containing protein [Fluviispira multicolorata]KAB8033356.1 transporter substrate-binding domain-containing protein [Fluviispira multicolorata]